MSVTYEKKKALHDLALIELTVARFVHKESFLFRSSVTRNKHVAN